MNRFLAVADMLGCGELVECKGWETELLSSRNPLMAYQHGPSKPLLCRIFSALVPTWCHA